MSNWPCVNCEPQLNMEWRIRRELEAEAVRLRGEIQRLVHLDYENARLTAEVKRLRAKVTTADVMYRKRVAEVERLREGLAALESDWKDFYTCNVSAWEVEHDEPLTLANYVHSILSVE